MSRQQFLPIVSDAITDGNSNSPDARRDVWRVRPAVPQPGPEPVELVEVLDDEVERAIAERRERWDTVHFRYRPSRDGARVVGRVMRVVLDEDLEDPRQCHLGHERLEHPIRRRPQEDRDVFRDWRYWRWRRRTWISAATRHASLSLAPCRGHGLERRCRSALVGMRPEQHALILLPNCIRRIAGRCAEYAPPRHTRPRYFFYTNDKPRATSFGAPRFKMSRKSVLCAHTTSPTSTS
jgi:hypothetical protein